MTSKPKKGIIRSQFHIYIDERNGCESFLDFNINIVFLYCLKKNLQVLCSM